MSFEGKVVLITGASSGIGAAAALYFAKEGALLALVGRNMDKLTAVFDGIKENDVENEPLLICGDITVDAEQIITETIEKYGRLDVLINCAGINVPSSIDDLKMEDFDQMMATNVRGTVQLTQLAIPHLIEYKGNIINISSALAIIAVPHAIGYSMSKAALDQFTRCLAMDMASKGVRVNSINPGFIDTDFHSMDRDGDEYAALVEASEKRHPLQRIGYSDDVVNAIAFMAKDSASFLTGVVLRVDGGLSTKGAF